jgi:glutaredoxin 3
MDSKTRTIEIFSAGCAVCEEAIREIRDAACPSCDIRVVDMKEPEIEKRARDLGIRSIPAVVINGRLAVCCSGRGIDMNILRASGLGQAIK